MPAGEPATTGEPTVNQRLPLWRAILAAALVAGCLAAIGGEFAYPALHKEPEYPASITELKSSQRAVARAVIRFKTKMAVETNQAMAAYGLLGVALGVAVGLAGGLTGGSRRAGREGAIIGGVLGGLAGEGLSILVVPLYFQWSNAMTTAPLLLLTHALIFTGVGAAAGAALGHAWGDRKVIVRCVIGGIIGALAATVVVDVINIAGFGVMRIFEPVPAQTAPRTVVHLGIALGAALGAARAGRKLRPGPSS